MRRTVRRLAITLPPVGKLGLPEGFYHGVTPGAVVPHTQNGADVARIGACSTAQFLLKRNFDESVRFTGEPAASMRRRYFAIHPTQVVVFKCMDGRLNVSVATQTPPGIITPFRNIAGRFDLGWPLLKEAINKLSEFATKRGQQTLMLCAYHFSKGDPHRGCAGNNFDTCQSIALARRLVEQLDHVFGGIKSSNAAVIPLLTGIETDDDALIFHSPVDDTTLHMGDFAAAEPDTVEIKKTLSKMFPNLNDRVAADLLPLLTGNARHIHRVRESKRPILAMEHMETVIGVGRGFDWLHQPNKALLVGPFEQDWGRTLGTAATIVLGNIRSKRVDPAEGIVIMPSALSFKPQGTYHWELSVETALYLGRTAAQSIKHAAPELLTEAKVHIMPGVVDGHTLRFWPIVPKEGE